MSDDVQGDVLTPTEQDTVTFYNRPIVAVRLADGRIAVVLRWMCEGLELDAKAQVRRIKRTEELADDMVAVRVETEGGHQNMPALLLRSLPYWLAGIGIRQVSEEIRPVIRAFKREVQDVLYRHFAERRPALTPPPNLVPAEPIMQPERPTKDAPRETWIAYHEQMAAWLQWQADIEAWRQGVDEWQGRIESRLESIEEVSHLVPEILERLGPQTLTPEHQHSVQSGVKRLHELTNTPYAAIYDELRQAFHVAKYSDIADTHWPTVAAWFKARIERARRP